ncbi:hypothetical protein MP11Mi_13960 [Gordonia sp. MP11Mi]|uniref:Uncharacterized protein n=1 Tax=Gordonia sp. MP11Mi TaxID=3022769 RepID=A0AA97GU35_9ACTN
MLGVNRIGVVEDHASVVLGVEAMLAHCPDLTVAASAPTVPELLAETVDLELLGRVARRRISRGTG